MSKLAIVATIKTVLGKRDESLNAAVLISWCRIKRLLPRQYTKCAPARQHATRTLAPNENRPPRRRPISGWGVVWIELPFR